MSRNGWITFATISAVSITLLILGTFFLLALNVNHIAANVENQLEIRVFLDLTAEQEEIDRVEKELKKLPNLQSYEFVDKEEGLQQLKESFEERASLFKGLDEENPLPHSFVVKVVNPREIEMAADMIKHIPHVDEVRYLNEQTLQRLFTATNLIKYIGVALIAGLAFTAMFLIANTIKLTIIARRHEIQIMKLVGATNAFIRWPYVIEGLLMGALGAVIPILLLGVGYYFLLEVVKLELYLYFINLLPMYPLVYQLAAILLAIGAFIGVWGSLMSMRRFLRV